MCELESNKVGVNKEMSPGTVKLGGRVVRNKAEAQGMLMPHKCASSCKGS